MKNSKNVPALRFKGFEEEWEEKQFSELAQIRRGLTYSPSDIRVNGIRVLRSSNINEDTFTISEDDVFVAKEAINIDFVKDDDILITSANGSSRLVGKHAIVSGITESTAVHGGFMLLATASEPYFINALMSSAWYARFINLHVAGGNGAIGNLNKKDLDEDLVVVPATTEQQAIGDYFQNIDKLIETSQGKLGKLKNIKEACLEKMFPKRGAAVPEIRFKGFTEEWKEKTIGDFCSITIGEFVIQTKQRADAPYPVFNGGVSHTGFYDEYNQEGNKIIISARGANAGFVNKAESRYWAGNSCYSIGVLDTTNWGFLFYSIKNQEQNFRKAQQSANIPSVSKKQVEKIIVQLPEKEEQEFICSHLQNLDDLIDQNKQQLEKLKNIKKACLERMFVNTEAAV